MTAWYKTIFLNEEENVHLKAMGTLGGITTAKQLAKAMEGTSLSMGEFDYKLNISAAYAENPVAYFCINLIGNLCSQPTPEIWLNDKLIDNKNTSLGGLVKLIERPNEIMDWADFVKQYSIYMDLAGESFIQRLSNGTSFKRGNGSIVLLPPDRVEITKDGYKLNDKTLVPFTDKNGTHEILHNAHWHPTSNRGLSPITPAWKSLSNHNMGQEWNHSLLKNNARLGLIAIWKGFTGTKTSAMTSQQLSDFNNELGKFTGSKNAGKTFSVQGDWDIKEVGQTQKDLDWNEMLMAEAKLICLPLGVDPIFLGFSGDSTYSNKREAYVGLMKFTVLPKLHQFSSDFEHWMKEIFPGDWKLRFNLEEVAALEPVRESLWERQQKAADILTKNERRELIGYPAIEEDVQEEVVEVVEPQPTEVIVEEEIIDDNE